MKSVIIVLLISAATVASTYSLARLAAPVCAKIEVATHLEVGDCFNWFKE